MTYEVERMDRFVVVSIFLHATLFAAVLFSPKLFPNLLTNWGSDKGGGNPAIKVKIAGGDSGIPLPKPEVVNEAAPANDSPGLYKSKEAPPPVPDKKAEPIPEKTAPVKKAAAPKASPAPPAPKAPPSPEPPSNAVPYGQGGRPAMSYGQFPTGAGDAGISFGDAAFGDRYGAYVNSITRAVSNNWLKSMVDARIQRAPRVYVTFDIARDGTVSNVSVQQSSGNPSLDRSAQRAVLASNPLPALPADYRGSSVNVIFYFEYSR